LYNGSAGKLTPTLHTVLQVNASTLHALSQPVNQAVTSLTKVGIGSVEKIVNAY
jgi:hypothetical protein